MNEHLPHNPENPNDPQLFANSVKVIQEFVYDGGRPQVIAEREGQLRYDDAGPNEPFDVIVRGGEMEIEKPDEYKEVYCAVMSDTGVQKSGKVAEIMWSEEPVPSQDAEGSQVPHQEYLTFNANGTVIRKAELTTPDGTPMTLEEYQLSDDQLHEWHDRII